MEIQTICADCVALIIHRAVDMAPTAAELVRAALELSGLSPWPAMELEVYPSGGDTLILARPSCGVTVAVADWLAPYID